LEETRVEENELPMDQDYFIEFIINEDVSRKQYNPLYSKL
jgi:hypothetical protein